MRTTKPTNVTFTAMLAALLVAVFVSRASAMYNPTLGTWTQRDPSGSVDGKNLYQYAASSPTNYIDERGAQAAKPAAAPDPKIPTYSVSTPWKDRSIAITWKDPGDDKADLVQKVEFTISGQHRDGTALTKADFNFDFHDEHYVVDAPPGFKLTYSEAWEFDKTNPAWKPYAAPHWFSTHNTDEFVLGDVPDCSSGHAKWSAQARWTTNSGQMATIAKDRTDYPSGTFRPDQDWLPGRVIMAGILPSRYGDSGLSTGGASRTLDLDWCTDPNGCPNGLTGNTVKVTGATSNPLHADWDQSVGKESH